MCSSATAGVGLVEEAGISVCTEDHVAQSVDNVIQRVGDNIVKEKMDSLFCGHCSARLAGNDGAECNQKFVVHRSYIVQQ